MSSQSFHNLELEKHICDLEYKIQRLRRRYEQIKQVQQQHEKLRNDLMELDTDPNSKNEAKIILDELSELEVILESALLRDDQLRYLFWQAIRKGLTGDVFWQALRFGGIGMILGWLLRS